MSDRKTGSPAAFPGAAHVESSISTPDRFVFLILYAHANAELLCWPAVRTISAIDGRSDRMNRASIARLLKAELVEWVDHPLGPGTTPAKGLKLRCQPAWLKRLPRIGFWKRVSTVDSPIDRQKFASRPTIFRQGEDEKVTPPSNSPIWNQNSGRKNEEADADIDAPFQSFWHAYPHPSDDPVEPARQAWADLVEGKVDRAIVLAAVQRYAQHLREPANAWRSRAQAKTWLRDKRWQVESMVSSTQPAASAPAILTGWEPVLNSQISKADQTRWLTALKALVAQEREAVVASWLTDCVVTVRDGELVLQAPSPFRRDWLRNHWLVPLARAWRGPVDIVMAPNGLRRTRPR